MPTNCEHKVIFSAALVNGQLVCLLPVGILKHVMFISIFIYHCLSVLVLKSPNGEWPIKYTYIQLIDKSFLFLYSSFVSPTGCQKSVPLTASWSETVPSFLCCTSLDRISVQIVSFIASIMSCRVVTCSGEIQLSMLYRRWITTWHI